MQLQGEIMQTTFKISKGVICNNLPDQAISKIEKDLSFTNPIYKEAMKQGRYISSDIPEKLELFYTEETATWIPRGYIFYLIRWMKEKNYKYKVKDHTLLLKPLNLKFKGELRPYQMDAAIDMLSYPIGVLDANTGSGKTVILIYIIVKRQQPTLIIVHSKELLYQWEDRILQFTGESCGLIGDGKFKVKPITVGIINTVKNKIPELKDKFGMIIIDECLHPDTEILTNKGWKWINGLDKTELVAQWDNNDISFIKPIKYIEKNFSGNLINIVGRNTDILATPTHQQPYRSFSPKTKRKFNRKKDIQDIKLNSLVELPISGNNNGELRNITPEIRFNIMTQADGHVYPRPKLKQHRKILFGFTKNRKIKRFLKILNQLPYKYIKVKPYKNVTRFIVTVPYPTNIKKELNQITELNQVSENFVDEFIDELMQWDGHIDNKRGILYYSSTDKTNTDYVQALCAIGGWKSSYRIQIDTRKKNYKDVHRLWLYKKLYRPTQRLKQTNIPYAGKVYCVRVPKGNIIIRRNNKVAITGNCHKIAANSYMDSLQEFPAKHYQGATATSFRRDGLGHTIFASIGPKKHTISKQMLFDTKAVLIPEVFRIDTNFNYMFLNDYSIMIKKLTEDEKRNKLICSTIHADFRLKGESILIVSDRKKHLENMQQTLWSDFGDESLVLTGSTKKKERQQIVEKVKNGQCKILFASLSLISEGFDLPDLTVLFLTTPIKYKGKLIQCCGRILRPKKGKQPRVYDFRDNMIDVLKYSGYSRDRVYRKEWDK